MRWRTVLVLFYGVGTALSSLLLIDLLAEDPQVSSRVPDGLVAPLSWAASRWIGGRLGGYVAAGLDSPLGVVLACLLWVLAAVLLAALLLSAVRRIRVGTR